jgi:hypothetical protein
MAGPVRGVAGAAEAPGPDVTGRAGAVIPRPARRRRWAWVTGFTAAGIALFAAYIRLSATYPVNSDGANIVLMSWDMLHGNLLLHNWWMSDVSFYTTDLPEYVLIDAIRGLSPDVTHIAAALTYTLAVVLAALLAKGRASSREGLARVLLSGGIMLAPQLGVGIFVLLLSVGHIGTAVPALAVWLLLDLSPRRWYIPVIVGVMLAWAMIADSLVLVVAIAPLVIVSGSRAVALLATSRPGPGSGTAPRPRSAWYELSLAAAAAAAWGASWLAGKAIHALGGYTLHAVPFSLVAPAHLGVHAATTGDSLLALFGANFGGLHSGVAVAFAVLHLAGLALVAWALARVLRRWTTAGLVDQLLAVAIVINLAMYLFGSFSSGVLNGREIALVLPFGAALAGRSLGPVLAQARPAPRAARLTLVLLAVLAGYVAGLGYELAQPVSPPANARLASWLQDHHLDHGLSGYWQASVVTIDSGGQVTIRAVTELGGGIVPYRWEAKSTWYSPGRQYANFVVLQNEPGFFNYWYPPGQIGATFGAPAHTYQLGPYTVLVWTHNLMPALHRWAVRTGTAATT